MLTLINPHKLAKGVVTAGTLVFTLASATVLAAPQRPLFVWDNQEGIKGADSSCVVRATDKIPFRVSQYTGRKNQDTENLRNFNGVRQSHLVNFSVVKTRIAPEKRDYTAIEVVGINQRTDAKANRWFSERGDLGYLYDLSVRPMEDFVFEVPLNRHNYQDWVINYIDELKADDKVYLRVAAGHSYYKLECDNQPDRDYILFRAYQRHFNDRALYYLAISAQETEIFKGLRTYGKVESMSFLAEVGNEVPISVDAQSLRESTHVSQTVEDEQDALEQAMADAEALQEQILADKATSAPESTTDTDEEKFISTEKVVCIGSSTLNVRNRDLDKVLFKARLGEKVKVFQSWTGDDTIEEVIGGVSYTFKRVEFADRESSDERIGFVAAPFIKKLSECAYLNNGKSVRANPVPEITGLDDPRCCDFPTVKEPTHSYTSGMRRFAAGRGGGTRLHAACDLYRYKNEPIRSVAPGKVIRNLYAFYQGTYALEVRHDGGFIVRYGEMTSKKYFRGGQRVKMGDRIGDMGKVNSGCCRPMLHFELYKGDKTGSLSNGRGKYRRRSDLMNPTEYLLKWQGRIF